MANQLLVKKAIFSVLSGVVIVALFVFLAQCSKVFKSLAVDVGLGLILLVTVVPIIKSNMPINMPTHTSNEEPDWVVNDEEEQNNSDSEEEDIDKSCFPASSRHASSELMKMNKTFVEAIACSSKNLVSGNEELANSSRVYKHDDEGANVCKEKAPPKTQTVSSEITNNYPFIRIFKRGSGNNDLWMRPMKDLPTITSQEIEMLAID